MPIEPTLAEVIREAITSRLLETSVAIPAVVQSYDAAKQVADCVPVVRDWVPTEDGAVKFEALPVIPNVPVAWFRGGGYWMQFPLKKGDHVQLVFNDCDVSRWRETGELSDQGDLVPHSLSHPIAYPVAAPDTSPLDAIGDDEVVLDGPTLIRMGGPSAEFLATASKVSDQLADLKSAINGWTPVAGDGGAALKTALTSWLASSSDVATTKLKGE